MKKHLDRAFPVGISDRENGFIGEGMTLRDYFAAKALSAYLDGGDAPVAFNMIAARCYRMADAMLRAREEFEE